jgi:DNA modification methylase
VVLDPFAGSGTTLEAALLEGFRAVGVEKDSAYVPLIRRRLDRRYAPEKFLRSPGARPAQASLFDDEEVG